MIRPSRVFAFSLCLLPVLGSAQNSDEALNRLLHRYTEAYGGVRDATSLSSLSIEGTIEQDGETFEFLARRKRPHSMSYRLSKGVNQVTTGYNGSSGWIRIEANGASTVKDLDEAATLALREKARFDSPLYGYVRGLGTDLTLVGRSFLGGEPVFVVEASQPDGRSVRYYLSVESALLRRRDELDATGAVVTESLFRDYKKVEGFPFAHEVEVRADGQTVSLAKVQAIDVNIGLLSFYFEKPR